MSETTPNRLYFGDNLNILREHIPNESVDLIYLDPPFNSNATYNVLFRERSGEQSAAQITAFEDTWHWSNDSEAAYRDVVGVGPDKVSKLLAAMLEFLGRNDMMAYLTMMSQRMIELHRVLKPTGSIYLHCDPTASHYLKMLMDATFGTRNFLNEISWLRSHTRSSIRRKYRRAHDVIFFCGKSPNYTFSMQYRDLSESSKEPLNKSSQAWHTEVHTVNRGDEPWQSNPAFPTWTFSTSGARPVGKSFWTGWRPWCPGSVWKE